jgi:hypothetical protein
MGMDAEIFMSVRLSHHEYIDHAKDGLTRVDNSTHAALAALLGVTNFAKATEGDITVEVPVSYFRKDYDLHDLIGKMIYAEGLEDEDWGMGGSCYLTLNQVKSILVTLEEIGNRRADYNGEPAGYRNYKWSNAVKHFRSVVKYANDNDVRRAFRYTAG